MEKRLNREKQEIMTDRTNAAADSTPVIKVKGLCKTFKVGFWGRKVEAVKDLDLEIYPNEIFGFLGPNGAGKTTAIKSILGLIHPTSGKISIFDQPHDRVSIRSRIGFLPETPYFYDYLTADEFMNFYGRLLGVDRSERHEKGRRLLEEVGLKGAEKLQLRKFSKGMIQRIGMAQALLNDPDLVILDEPMSGLDPLGRKEVRDIILRLKEQGKTVFFSTHILPDVEMICDRVGIIREGEMVEVGSLHDILETSDKGVEVTVKGVQLSDLPKKIASSHVMRGDTLHMILEKTDRLSELLSAVIEKNGQIIDVSPHRESLESYFVQAFENVARAGKENDQ